jgi:methylenetetrahydrofolate dehydrogenase (NADP+)/methenyltetrahydrofolate cyclohydrolase
MYQLIDGKKISEELREKIRQEVSTLPSSPGLAVVLIGNDPASEIYVNLKHKACEKAGIKSFKHELPENTSQEELLLLIKKLNEDKSVNGILVQMPFPKHIERNAVLKAISPEKDVDGLHPENIGRLVMFEPCLKPCTPRGVMKLLHYYNIDMEGKEVVIIGRSMIVGTPMTKMFMNENATVTVCHSKTKDLKFHTSRADILVSAAGRKDLVTKDMVKEGAIVIDVGTNKFEGKLYGDVDFENVKDKCSYITPVPKGVGPMTIACLLENTLIAYKRQRGLEK